MSGVFLYFLTRTFKNRILSLAARLRRPRYLISAAVGLAYLYLVFLHQYFSRPRTRTRAPLPPDLAALPLLEAAGALFLLGLVLLPWIWPGRGAEGLRFSEAEIQFLFPAPLSRRALIHFRLAKMQFGTIFTVLVSFLFFGRGKVFAHPAFFLAVLWIVYSFLGLYHVGASLAQTSLARHGTSGYKVQAWAFGFLAALLTSILVWLKWFLPPLPEPTAAQLADFSGWLVRATQSGPAYYFLLPLRALIRPAFAPDAAAFVQRLAPALLILGLVYLWVMRSDAAFEEASLARARKLAGQLEAARKGIARRPGGAANKLRRPPFALSPSGHAHTAIFWKNLISIGRLDTLRIIPILAVVAVGLAVALSSRAGERDVVPAMIGTFAGMAAGFLALIGPLLVRDDFRNDLLQAELLKTYPIPGRSVALGEVLAPAAVLAAGEWILLLISGWLLPGVGKWHPTVPQRFLVGASLGLLLPCFSLLGLLVQNAAALLLPGWVQLGKGRRQGIEAMGQRLISMAATWLLLLCAVLPAAVLFGIVFFAGYRFLGMAILPPASLLAACGLLAEAGLAVLWLGRLFDKFDVSLAGIDRE